MKTQDTHPDQKLTEIDGLTQAGKRAEAAYQWEQAVEHYTTALELLPSSPTPDQQQAYDLLERRAYCYDRLADYANEIPDLERMVALGEQLDDPERTLEALTHLSQAYSDLGQTEAALELTRRAVSLSAVHALPYYQARALYAQAYAELASGEYHMAEQNFTTAMANFACLGAKTDEAWCAYRLAFCAVYTGANGLDIAHHMQALIHGLDNRLLEARSAHIFAILTDPEPSVSRAYL
ncbi:MAG: hypothetical protein ACK2UW_22240, partial [Anaerolineales bacterium]